MSELLRPFQATSNLIGTKYMTPFTQHGVMRLTDEEVKQSTETYAQYILNESL